MLVLWRLRRATVVLTLSLLMGVPASAETDNPAAGATDERADPRRFSGRVVSEAGEPLAGARIYLSFRNRRYEDFPDQTKPGERLRVRAVTDSEGRFDFLAEDAVFTDLDGLPTGRCCRVHAEADGYGADGRLLNWRARSEHGYRDDAGRGLSLRLPVDDTPLRGRFVDSDGRPLAGLQVSLRSLVVPKNRNLDQHLERVKKLTIGDSAPGFELWLSPPYPPGVQSRVTTDAEGWFTMQGLGKDRLVSLLVTGPGIGEQRVSAMTREAESVGLYPFEKKGVPTQTLHGSGFSSSIESERLAQVRGRVVTADTGEPIAGMRVGLGRTNNGRGYPRNGVLSNETVSDANGWFTVTGISLKRKELYVVAESPSGTTYLPAGRKVDRDALAFGNPVFIECRRGIPFRLTVTDTSGRPVEGDVTYNAVLPNPHAPRSYLHPHRRDDCVAVSQGDGVYEGFVQPGPGAVLVRTPGVSHRVASVDPKGFFEPGRAEWTASKQRIGAYGNAKHISTTKGSLSQFRYAAVVLINPEVGSGPLELRATVHPNPTREVTLRDAEGRPLTGVTVRGLPPNPTHPSAPTRTSRITLSHLHPDRETRLLFHHKEKRLSGFLRVRGDSDSPLTVRLSPWGVLQGKILNEQGEPLHKHSVRLNGDAVNGYHGTTTNRQGEFRIEKIIPGEAYDVTVSTRGRNYGKVRTDLRLEPGETRDLGDLRVRLLDER